LGKTFLSIEIRAMNVIKTKVKGYTLLCTDFVEKIFRAT